MDDMELKSTTEALERVLDNTTGAISQNEEELKELQLKFQALSAKETSVGQKLLLNNVVRCIQALRNEDRAIDHLR